MENDVQFLEEFMKKWIINKFRIKVLAEEDQQLAYVEFEKPILTMCDRDEKSKNFALTNICMWNKKLLHGDVYNVEGVIDNKGRIFITGYEVQA